MDESQDAGLRHSILMGSEAEYDFPCHPCSSGGRNMEASGYCMDCGVYLCGHCINCHKTLPVTAHHQVVDKDKMPTNQHDAPPVKVICTERCTIHKDKVIEYLCHTHNFMGCSACIITQKHAMCKDVEYIPEAAAGLKDRADYKAFTKRLGDLTEKSKDAIKYCQESLKRVTDNSTKVIQEIEAYQQEINKTLNTLKYEIKQQAMLIKDEDTAIMNSLTDEGSTVLKELETMSKEIKEQLDKKHYSQIFIQMKSTEKKLSELEKRLAGIDRSSMSIYEFKKNAELSEMLKRKNGFGTLVLTKDREIHTCTYSSAHEESQDAPENRATHVANINVKSKRNKKTCQISAATLLSANHLVIADNENDSVKLIDVENKTIESELKLEKFPFQVAKIDEEHMAVTLPASKKIMLLNYDTRKGLDFDRLIKMNAECWGIAYIEDKLVVCVCNPAEVRILSMNGNVLQTFATDGKRNALFKNPTRVAADAKSECIYVSDWKQNCMTVLDMDGKVKVVYNDDELRSPAQLAVDDKGMVYLCGEASHNIHLLTADGKKVKVLLGQSDGAKYPRSICYCEATQRLYVGMYDNNVVKVYQMT